MARAIVLVASGALLLALAGGVFFRPARRAVGAVFVHHVPEGPAFSVARDDELRRLLHPLVMALALLGVVMAATVLRAA